MRRTFISACAVFALSLTGALANAQTTHTIDMSGISYSPSNLTICVGDTVLWNWVDGFHNVESGVGGVSDGIFTSGAPIIAPNQFSVTFDQAFLTANPVSGNVYDYFCVVHVGFGMIGAITVVNTAASSVIRNGSGCNPLGFSETSPAVLGTNWDTAVDIVTPGAAASALAIVDTGPFQAKIGLGEILIDVGTPFLGGIRIAAGAHSVPIPNDLSLVGTTFFTQAATINVGPLVIQAQNAIDVTVGCL